MSLLNVSLPSPSLERTFSAEIFLLLLFFVIILMLLESILPFTKALTGTQQLLIIYFQASGRGIMGGCIRQERFFHKWPFRLPYS